MCFMDLFRLFNSILEGVADGNSYNNTIEGCEDGNAIFNGVKHQSKGKRIAMINGKVYLDGILQKPDKNKGCCGSRRKKNRD